MFQAEARTLARAGFDVTEIALEDDTESATDGVSIITLPPPRNRLNRFMRTGRILLIALRQNCDLYTIHDPELLPLAVLLKIFKRRPVIYDVHEDVPASIRNRQWLPRPLRPITAIIYRLIERISLHFIAGLTIADHAYGKYYANCQTLTVLNYPLTSYAELYEKHVRSLRPPTLIYTGSITRLRGLHEMIEIVQRLRLRYPDLTLRLVGPFGSNTDRTEATQLIHRHDLENHVEFTGPVSHAEVHRLILDADVGLAILHPDPNYLHSLPTKMFEYMMMARPVVVSNFPMWEEIVEDCGCGYAIDPHDLDAIVSAIDSLLADKSRRENMGVQGRIAVLKKYNWENEGARMIEFYRKLMGMP